MFHSFSNKNLNDQGENARLADTLSWQKPIRR